MLLMMKMVFAAGLSVGVAMGGGGFQPEARAIDGCYISGCNSEVCSNATNVQSRCLWKPEFACYRNAFCGHVDSAGQRHCEWVQSPRLAECFLKVSVGNPIPANCPLILPCRRI